MQLLLVEWRGGPIASFDMARNLHQYDGFVSAVVAQITAGLTAQVTPNQTKQHEDDPSLRASKRLKVVNAVETGARAALLARFALAVDDVLYLNSGIALLAAGHVDNTESPIDVSGLAGIDIFNHVRNTVLTEIQKRDDRRYKNRDIYIEKLVKLISWLCTMPEVARALQMSIQDDDEYTELHDALEAVAYEVQDMATYVEFSEAVNDDENVAKITTKAAQLRKGVEYAIYELNAEPKCQLFRIFLEMTDKDGTLGEFVHGIEQKARNVAKGVARTRHALSSDAPPGLFQGGFDNISPDTNAPMSSLHSRAEQFLHGVDGLLQMNTGVVQAVVQAVAYSTESIRPNAVGFPARTVPPDGYENLMAIFKTEAARVMKSSDRQDPLTADLLAHYCEMRGLVGEKGPTEVRYDDEYKTSEPGKFQYNFPVESPPRMLERPPLASGVRNKDRFMVKSHILKNEIDMLRSFVDDGFELVAIEKRQTSTLGSYVENTMPVRWRPNGEYAEAQARVAIMEHAIEKLKEVGFTPRAVAQVQGACKLRQLDDIRKLAKGIVLREESADACVSWEAKDGKMYYTRPSKVYNETKVRIPYDAGLVLVDTLATTREPSQAIPLSLDTEWKQKINGLTGTEVDWHANYNAEENHLKMISQPPLDEFVERMKRDDINFQTAPFMYMTVDAKHTLSYSRFDNGPASWIPQTHFQEDSAYDLSTETLAAYFREGIELCAYMDDHTDESEAVPMSASTHAAIGAPPTQTIEGVRKTLWQDTLREIAISNDKLWIFVRTLSGAMGEDASTVLTQADEATHRAQKALEMQRKGIADKVATFYSKLVETVVAGVMRTSKLEALPFREAGTSIGGEELFVMDSEFAKDIRALASGESGRPFFEANVAIQQVLNNKNGEKTSLATLISSFTPIVSEMHRSLNSELLHSTTATVGFETVATPRNAYQVSLRQDVVTAIRISLDRLHHELRQRRPSLWELVEGASSHLSLRFAELCAHVLVSTRASSGTSSLYVSSTQVATNALQTRVALGRLVSESRAYLSAFPQPDFLKEDGRDEYFFASGGKTSSLVAQTAMTMRVGMTSVPRLITSSDSSMWAAKYG